MHRQHQLRQHAPRHIYLFQTFYPRQMQVCVWCGYVSSVSLSVSIPVSASVSVSVCSVCMCACACTCGSISVSMSVSMPVRCVHLCLRLCLCVCVHARMRVNFMGVCWKTLLDTPRVYRITRSVSKDRVHVYVRMTSLRCACVGKTWRCTPTIVREMSIEPRNDCGGYHLQ